MEKIIILFAATVCCINGYTLNTEINQESFDRITNGNFAADQQFPYAVHFSSEPSGPNPILYEVARNIQRTDKPDFDEIDIKLMVSIQQQSTEQNVSLLHRCGGVLITFQHVLTTASCTYNTVNGTNAPIVANAYRVFAGSAILSNNNSANQVRAISNYTVHPQYLGAPSMLNDIAVIFLASPFSNTAVVPLSLPVGNFIPDEHTECTVAGWGASVAGNNASSQLRFATNYIYNQELCTTLHNSIVGVANILPSMICAASYDITSVGCTGDEGNALVCNGQLTGILSITNNCQATSYPEVYTRVSNYTTWIRSVTAGASSVKPEVVFLGLFTLFQIVTIKIFS